MRTDRQTELPSSSDLQDLQDQIDDLRLRTDRVEAVLVETGRTTTSQPRESGRRASGREPRAGDFVTFRATKITPGGTGHITRVVRNFVLIRRADGTVVQRAPRNVRVLRSATDDGEQA